MKIIQKLIITLGLFVSLLTLFGCASGGADETKPLPESVKASVIQAVGEKTEKDKPRITSIICADQACVLQALQDVRSTPELELDGMKLDSIKIFKESFADKRLLKMTIIWHPYRTNNFGKQVFANSVVLRIAFTKATWARVDPDNVDIAGLPAIADGYSEKLTY